MLHVLRWCLQDTWSYLNSAYARLYVVQIHEVLFLWSSTHYLQVYVLGQVPDSKKINPRAIDPPLNEYCSTYKSFYLSKVTVQEKRENSDTLQQNRNLDD